MYFFSQLEQMKNCINLPELLKKTYFNRNKKVYLLFFPYLLAQKYYTYTYKFSFSQ